MPDAMRAAIARLMTYSKTHIPHYYLTMRASVDTALARRESWNAAHGETPVSVNDLVLKATALALEAHPAFNALYEDEAVKPQAAINLGVAIALDGGLIAPAVLDCAGLPIVELGRRVRDLAARARAGTLKAHEYTAATFTITNLGMYGVESFLPIIVPPQIAILAVGAALETPVLADGRLTVAHRMALTLAADHRVTDGAEGARFLQSLVQALEDPAQLFGEAEERRAA
jgi:pyruvate dehydrogenase E2 component (dihydrolipoamide acetyltransferase)